MMGAGFGVDTNKVVIMGNDNKMKSFQLKSKREVAADIVNEIILCWMK
jgi:phosphopantothenoylcysteine decarboxylase / phosphopantothenate---cysteine ligase